MSVIQSQFVGFLHNIHIYISRFKRMNRPTCGCSSDFILAMASWWLQKAWNPNRRLSWLFSLLQPLLLVLLFYNKIFLLESIFIIYMNTLSFHQQWRLDFLMKAVSKALKYLRNRVFSFNCTIVFDKSENPWDVVRVSWWFWKNLWSHMISCNHTAILH